MYYLLFYGTIILIVLVVFFVIRLVLIPQIFGAPFLRSSKKTRAIMFELADIKEDELVIDLGSGDGVILIEAAEKGARAIGYEINPFLVSRSRIAIKTNKLEDKVTVFKKSFWSADLSQADVIMLFGISHIMPQLYKKLQRELKPGARVISNTFTFPKWQPEKVSDNVKLYRKK